MKHPGKRDLMIGVVTVGFLLSAFAGGISGGSMALSSKERKRLPDHDFVYPGRRAYPIQDAHQAKVALNTVFRFPATRNDWGPVSRAVFGRYPELRDWWDALPSVVSGDRPSAPRMAYRRAA